MPLPKAAIQTTPPCTTEDTTTPAPAVVAATRASDHAVELITHFEHFYPKAYQDPAGIWTIGYGTIRANGKRVALGMTCTKAEATQWMRQDIDAKTADILRVCGVPLKQQELDALVSFVYNVGIGNFQDSSLLKNIKAKRPVTETNFTSWNKARVNGRLTPLPGLLRRRRAEYFLYTQGRVKVQFT